MSREKETRLCLYRTRRCRIGAQDRTRRRRLELCRWPGSHAGKTGCQGSSSDPSWCELRDCRAPRAVKACVRTGIAWPSVALCLFSSWGWSFNSEPNNRKLFLEWFHEELIPILQQPEQLYSIHQRDCHPCGSPAFFHKPASRLCGLASNSSGLPCSATRPPSRTTTWSKLRMRCSLCARTTTVHGSASSMSCTFWSLSRSTEEVGSSHSSTRSARRPPAASRPRLSDRSCRSPWLSQGAT